MDYLGLSVEEFNMGWVARYRSPSGAAAVQLVAGDATAPEDSVISVHVGADVDEAYEEAKRRGYALAFRYAGRQVPREVLLEAWPAEERILTRLLGEAT